MQNLHDVTIAASQLRAVAMKKGEPHASSPTQSLIAGLARHGGMYTLLDQDLMTARVAAFLQDPPANTGGKPCAPIVNQALIAKLQSQATFFFYKLVDNIPGYTLHDELIAYISEPGRGNGVAYDECAEASDVPAAFTFVGQFIDHDLTFNGMNLTDSEGNAVQDIASPVIDLDNVYGPRLNVIPTDEPYCKFYDQVFDQSGKFRLKPVHGSHGKGWDVPRNDSVCDEDPNFEAAYIFDPRNDENQLLLQIHILIERLHNRLIEDGFAAAQLGPGSHSVEDIIAAVRKEVVATWQSFVLHEYMPAILREDTLEYVLQQMSIKPTDAAHPQTAYGDLKHKPYMDLVTGKNIVRMPHEFAIGFRFGHSQLRPMYLLNKRPDGSGNVVLLFKDARVSPQVEVCTRNGSIYVDGSDDLSGHRKLAASHVVDWNVFYPAKSSSETSSMLIDHRVTARVFNLPESAIPDDVKYIGNLPQRNLLRGSQIGVVSGEELARFYGYTPLTPDEMLEQPDRRDAVRDLFKLDSSLDPKTNEKAFKTPLWYYILREAYVQKQGKQLGELGSRLVAEVLSGAMFYSNEYAFDYNWKSYINNSNRVTLRGIIDYVNAGASMPATP